MENPNSKWKSLVRCSNLQQKTCSSLKRKRLLKDCISSLPDEVLLLIMSFLTFEEVVKKSILSRRWLNLWAHTLVIDLRSVGRKKFHTVCQKKILRNSSELGKFIKFVNRVLGQHKGQDLKVFKIGCALDRRHQKYISNWFKFALRKKVECLELNFLLDGINPSKLHRTYAFPDPFLCLGRGEAIPNGGKIQSKLDDLKCLKSLCLKRVDVSGDAIDFFLQNCPFLERLEVVGSLKLVKLVICDPSLVLKYLKITYCVKLDVLSISNFNLVSLDISAVKDLTLSLLPMLVELFITGASAQLHHSISQASICFSQLKSFSLKATNTEEITRFSDYDQLIQLERLVIDLEAKGDDVTKLFAVANHCPRLKEFVLKWYPEREFMDDGLVLEPFGRHESYRKSQSLKVFELMGYSGDDADVKLIMHVVENSVSLEKIIIDPRDVFFIGCFTLPTGQEEKVRRIVMEQFDSLRASIPPHINLILRGTTR